MRNRDAQRRCNARSFVSASSSPMVERLELAASLRQDGKSALLLNDIRNPGKETWEISFFAVQPGGHFPPAQPGADLTFRSNFTIHFTVDRKQPPRRYPSRCNCAILNGAGGGGRTLMSLRTRDFESRASASSTTPASSGAARPGHYLYTASRADSNSSGLFSKKVQYG